MCIFTQIILDKCENLSKCKIDMEIKRKIMAALVEWKQRHGRKPLIIQGIHQTGKTWIMRKFGEKYFEHTAYFNFDASEELRQKFLRGNTRMSCPCGSIPTEHIALARRFISGRQSGIPADISRYLPRVFTR